MAMMITGKIRSRSRAQSTIGKMNATTMNSAGSPYFLSRATPLVPAPLHRRAVAEQARRPENEHHEENGEDHDRGPPDAYVLVGHGADDADQEPPDHSPGQVADAPEDRRRERVEPLLEPHVKDRDPVEEPVHHARGPGEDAGQEERYGDRAVDVDADHRRRLLVLGDGPHRLTLLGTANEVGESHEQRHRHPDHEEVLPPEDDRVGDELRERDLGWPLPREADVLEDKGHADGRDQDRQPRRVPQGFVRYPLDPHPEESAGDHGDRHGYEDPAQLDKGARVVGDRAEEAEPQKRSAKNGQTYEGADHEVVAVGEVDQLDDPVDERVAERDEGDDGPVGDPDDQLRDELRGVPRRLHEQ